MSKNGIVPPIAPIAITPGDPAGIGIDIVLKAHQQGWLENAVVIADQKTFDARATQLGISSQGLRIFDIPLEIEVQAGKPDPRTATYIIKTLNAAVNGAMRGAYSAIVTGPINKTVINKGGIHFVGHTQYIAALTKTIQPVMMFIANETKLALVTDHIPLAQVPQAVTSTTLSRCIHIVHDSLQRYFGLQNPRILICGLNPHAGENGYLGKEELITIIPTISSLQKKGINAKGPISADIAFTPATLQETDIVVALYHDQGLPVIKHLGFHNAVNITLGLPFIRTSVDHGTAYDLAGTGRADANSLGEAIRRARQMLESVSSSTLSITK